LDEYTIVHHILVANLIAVPSRALLIVWIIALSEGLQIGMILVGMPAGTPFLPKLVQVAKGNMPSPQG
jgi:predicted Na+-dependent transporter